MREFRKTSDFLADFKFNTFVSSHSTIVNYGIFVFAALESERDSLQPDSFEWSANRNNGRKMKLAYK
jgi:hypothetical protein